MHVTYAINEILFYLHVTHAINGFQKKKKTHAINERLFIFHVMHASVHLLILSFIITKLKKTFIHPLTFMNPIFVNFTLYVKDIKYAPII